MESFQAVLRAILSRIQQIPLRIPSPEQILPPTTRQAAYDIPPTRWGEELPAGANRSRFDDPPSPVASPGVHPRRPGSSGMPWRWAPEALGITRFPTPRGLLTCQPII